MGWIKFAFPTADWSFISGAWAGPATALADDAAGDQRGQLAMLFNPARAGKLLEGSGHDPQQLLAAARAGKPLPRFELPVRIRATTRTTNRSFRSANLIARFEGSDPRLRDEHVVLSAHIDGRGIGEPVNGDRIYNGAIDNASGVAVLLEIAAELNRQTTRPKRSILFTFFTAEEGAMLGSKYFVNHPTVDPRSLVATLNVEWRPESFYRRYQRR